MGAAATCAGSGGFIELKPIDISSLKPNSLGRIFDKKGGGAVEIVLRAHYTAASTKTRAVAGLTAAHYAPATRETLPCPWAATTGKCRTPGCAPCAAGLLPDIAILRAMRAACTKEVIKGIGFKSLHWRAADTPDPSSPLATWVSTLPPELQPSPGWRPPPTRRKRRVGKRSRPSLP